MLYLCLLQPLDVFAAQQLTATTSATATPSAPSEPQAQTELPDPLQQQGSGANGQPLAAAAPAAEAPAAEGDQLPAPAAAAATAAAAAAPVHAGGSSRPSSHSSSRRTENLARPTLGFSSGDECDSLSLACACRNTPSAECACVLPSSALHGPLPTCMLCTLTKCPSNTLVLLQRVGWHRRRA